MSKDSSAKYYQKNKERLPKKSPERYQGLSDNMVANNIKVYQKMKNKSLLRIKKNVIK